MSSPAYHFTTVWDLPAPPETIYDLLAEPEALPRWWPSVYLFVTQVEPAGPDGLGGRIALYTKGWLPYTLRWSFRVTENRRPTTLALEATGDFVGYGRWTLIAHDGGTRATYDWAITAEKPLLRTLSPLLRPVFAANHRWAMARGEESIRLELRRLAGEPDVPPPPGPTFAPRPPA